MDFKDWKIPYYRPEVPAALTEAGYPPLLSAMLALRGIKTAEQARAMLDCGEEELFDPLLMTGMAQARDRVLRAIEDGEKVAVYGDYDVDGITATCLLTHYLRARGARVIDYIPSRMDEGYGLNPEALHTLAGQGVTLLITVDCGITACEEALCAKSLGMELIITDHHECKGDLPDALAVINPHRPDCIEYPFEDLAGVGVALKLAMALCPKEGWQALLDTYTPLAAIGTVADVMPLLGENRILVRAGLHALQDPHTPGMRALYREAGLLGKAVTATTLGFVLAPRINAAGRMGSASVACELLLTDDPRRADELAAALCQLNRDRQAIEGGIFDQCVHRLEDAGAPIPSALVLADANWHQGVVGIVASRLTEKYARPAFMICLDGGKGKGSCRSYGGFNLFAALESCSDLLEGFGGHALAAGFTILEEHIDAFRARMSACVDAYTVTGPAQSVLSVDALLPDAALLNFEGVDSLRDLEPFGAANPTPVFSLEDAVVTETAPVGGDRHVRLTLRKNGKSLSAIFFSAGQDVFALSAGDRVDIAFSPRINEFRGRRTVQLQLCDLCLASERQQRQQAAYDRFRAGAGLDAGEARSLLPEGAEFSAVWRYLRRAAAGGRLEEYPERLAHNIAERFSLHEAVPRVMICLTVFEECGLLTLDALPPLLVITLRAGGDKVELDASPTLRRLRGAAQTI